MSEANKINLINICDSCICVHGVLLQLSVFKSKSAEGEQFTRICAASRSKECVPPLLAWPFTSCSGTITNDVTDIPNDQCSVCSWPKTECDEWIGKPFTTSIPFIFHMRNFAAPVRHQRQSMWQALQIADQEMRRYFLMVLIRNNRTVASSHLPSGLAIWNQGVDAPPPPPTPPPPHKDALKGPSWQKQHLTFVTCGWSAMEKG